MIGITVNRALKEMTSDNLRRHRIVRVPERKLACLAVYLLNISNSGMIAEYRVRVGEFRIYVRVLNLNFKVIRENQNIG
jgi:hypothetical protein